MFERKRKNPVSAHTRPLKDLSKMVNPIQFLADGKRQALLNTMKEFSGLEQSRYSSLCEVLIENLVSYCQNIPETSIHYYAHPGGLVDHALNRTEAALSLFQEFVIHDEHNQLSEEQKLWQYALFSAAILQGIGKLCIDYRVHVYDINGQLLKIWNPLLESLIHIGSYYDYEFMQEADIEFRKRLNLLLAKTLMPPSGFSWIASDAQVLAVWLALLNEDQRSAGTLGALLIRADAIAIQRYFSELLGRGGLGHGGPFGRAGTFSGGVPERLIEKEQAVGMAFVEWLIKSLDEGRIMINKSPLFMVPGGMLMSKEMFQLFIRENPEYKNWQAIQKGFLSLGLHGLNAQGGVNSRFEQVQNQQMHNGVVFSGYAVALPQTLSVHHMGTGEVQSLSAVELINQAQFNTQFTQPVSVQGTSLQKLTASGQWQNIENVVSSFLSPGAKDSG